jgi:hypothetical protein
LFKISYKLINIAKHVNLTAYFINHIGLIAHNVGHYIFKIFVGEAFHFGGIFAKIPGCFFATPAATYWDRQATAQGSAKTAAVAFMGGLPDGLVRISPV